jgi:hypothetical protein
VPIVLKFGSLNLLEPSGPVQGCAGIALPLPLVIVQKKVMYTCLYKATLESWSAADYTGYLILVPEICTVYCATDWTVVVTNTPNCTVLVHTTTI